MKFATLYSSFCSHQISQHYCKFFITDACKVTWTVGGNFITILRGFCFKDILFVVPSSSVEEHGLCTKTLLRFNSGSFFSGGCCTFNSFILLLVSSNSDNFFFFCLVIIWNKKKGIILQIDIYMSTLLFKTDEKNDVSVWNYNSTPLKFPLRS